jgi:hypothetical protein
MALLTSQMGDYSGSLTFGEINLEQVQRMMQAPTEGPFYMVNLIRYGDKAAYPDGRESDLTGREANALYSPIEFLAAIGARVVFSAEVDQQIDGDDPIWHDVAVVEYPCPVAFFAMIAHPDFQARAVHKKAGVETTYVMHRPDRHPVRRHGGGAGLRPHSCDRLPRHRAIRGGRR